MKKINRILIYSPILLVIPFLFGGCKEQPENESTQSERQLHSFNQGTVGFAFNPPTLVNDYIYIGTSRGWSNKRKRANDNAFYKLDANLNKIWEYPLGFKEVMGAATLDNYGNIYFIVGEGNDTLSPIPTRNFKLYSLGNDGKFRWAKETCKSCSRDFMSNPAISKDNIIYAGGDKFYAFDINGNEIWNFTGVLNQVMSAPIIDLFGNIFFIDGSTIFSFDKNGVERWHYKDNEYELGTSPAFSVDYSKIYVAIYQSIYCIGSGSGNLIWKYTIPEITGWFKASPAVDNNNNIYIGNHGLGDDLQSLYAIKANGSGLIWKRNIGADMYSSPALGNDGVVYVGSECGFTGPTHSRLHAIDMETGEIVWSAKLEMDVLYSSPAISNDGILYIATMDMYSEGFRGMVYAFRTNSTGLLPNAGSPRFHVGNASTGRRD